MSTGSKYTDEELVRLLQQNNKSALDYLYDKYSGALYGVVLKIMNGDEEAAEATFQEAFVKIWNNIGTYDGNKTTLFIWMLNITREVSVINMQSLKTEAIHSNKSNVYAIDGETQNMTLNQDEAENSVKLESKTIFDMVYYDGYTQKEVAEKLNMPMEKVCMQIRAALTEIRNKFS